MNTVKSRSPDKIVLILGVSLVLGLLFDIFFYGHVPGLAFPIYIALILAGLLGINHFLKQRASRAIAWFALGLVFFSGMVAIRASAFLTLLNIVMSIVLLLLVVRVSIGESLKNFSVRDHLQTLVLPFKFVNPLLDTLARIPKLFPASKDKQVIGQIVKGIAITVPVLFVLLLLLSSADLVFQKYIQNIVQLNIEPEIISRALLVLVVALAFIGAYSYIFNRPAKTTAPAENSRKPFFGKVEGTILLGSVNALFLIFIIIQIAYLFGGQSNISGQGFTYAEYARKGFFELIAVALISFVLVWIVEHRTAKRTDSGAHPRFFKGLSALLIAQVIIIMASAFKRLWLYEDAYGFTTLRFYSHALIIVLAVIFGLLLYKILKDGRENVFAFRVFLTFVVALIALNFINPDAFIARRNIERFSSTGKLDTSYLASLSADAVPETVKVLDSPHKTQADELAPELASQRANLDDEQLQGWQSWNWSRQNAKEILDSKDF